MPQDVFNMPDRASVEEQCRGNGMAEHMRRHLLFYSRHLAKAAKPDERRTQGERPPIRAHHKEGLAAILSPHQVLFNPVERSGTEENHSLFIAFAHDGRLPCLEIDGRALEGKPLRDPYAGAQEDLHERPEAQPLEIKPALTFVDRNCGDELLHFFRREVEDLSLGYARTAT